ncbi:MAG: DUF3426 domain-containing protein [Pseudomonadota bacterium]
MYTQCPECAVVLTISAHDLRAADGEVCCGACNHTFNALHHLVDTDEDLVSDVMAAASDEDAESLEASSTDEHGDQENATGPTADAEQDEENIAWSRTIAALGLADEATLKALDDYDQTHNSEPEVEQDEEDKPAQPVSDSERLTDKEVVFELVGEIDDPVTSNDFDPDELLSDKTTSPWLKRTLWSGIVIASFGLLIQVVHFQRNELAIDSRWGKQIQQIYSRIGLPLDPNWDVKQYDIADGGGSADPRLPGILLVRARLSNLGDLQMPLPLIKLNLKDRWGDLVGGRTFTPPEYLSDTGDNQFLLPGASVMVQLRVVDPGENANGFSLDACLSTKEGRLRCRYDSLTASN